MAIPGSNNNAGEYVATPRKTLFQCPVIAGYTTGRLVSSATLSSGTIANTLMMGFFENESNVAVSVQLQQCNDRTPTGTRTNVGAVVALAAYGQKTVTFQPTQQYLEVNGTSGTGNIRLTLDGQVKYSECAFSKDELAGTGGQFYPIQVWGPANLPPILGPVNPTDGPAQFNW